MGIDTSYKAEEFKPPLAQRSLFYRILLSRQVLLIAFLILFALVVAAFQPKFLTFQNFRVIITVMGFETVVAIAMGVQLINGMFDLSVAGVANMCGVIVGALMASGMHPAPAMVIAFAVGACVGIINGMLVTKLGTNAMVTTLGTWWACQGIAYGLTGGISFHRFSEGFQALGQGRPLGIDTPIWYMLIFTAVITFVMAKTKFGYHIYATGGDRRAARLNGVKTDQLTIIVFVLSALAAAFCGIMYTARLNASAPMAVVGLEMRCIAAGIIGGISMAGGEGLVAGSVLGMLFMYMLKNATVMIGVSVYWEYTVLGLVLTAAVAFDALSRKRTTKSR